MQQIVRASADENSLTAKQIEKVNKINAFIFQKHCSRCTDILIFGDKENFCRS